MGESKQQEQKSEIKNDVRENGCLVVEGKKQHRIQLLTIIGEIEGHEKLGNASKTTKYEHILPILGELEDDPKIDGVLILINTMGGDIEAGLAIAEMIASLSKPTCSLVLGGSHSIGVPIATSADCSFIVPTDTMVIHPVRLSGTVIGVSQTFDYFRQIQNRITSFICNHSKIDIHRLEEMMMETGFLTKEVGSILVGEEAVNEGVIDEVGGIKDAFAKLHKMISKVKAKDDKQK